MPATFPEHDSDQEWELLWTISDALLAAVDNLAKHPGDHAAAARVAAKVVRFTHQFDPTSEGDMHAEAAVANQVFNEIVRFAGEHDKLTTSDLQGALEAVALRLIRHEISGEPGRTASAPGEGGGRE